MDTSENYIKMCEKAIEIQEQSKCRHSYASNETLWNSNDKVILGKYKKGTFKTDSDYNLFISGWWSGESKHIWLPRQDQLQEMVINFGRSQLLSGVLVGLSMFASDNRQYNDSFEQLWLAFVMKEKYNKFWNGETWIN